MFGEDRSIYFIRYLDSSNNIYIAGQSIFNIVYDSSGVIQSTSPWGMSLRKYDSDGNIIWEKFVGDTTGILSSGAMDLAIDSTGKIYVTGGTIVSSFEGVSGSNLFLVKYMWHIYVAPLYTMFSILRTLFVC